MFMFYCFEVVLAMLFRVHFCSVHVIPMSSPQTGSNSLSQHCTDFVFWVDENSGTVFGVRTVGGFLVCLVEDWDSIS